MWVVKERNYTTTHSQVTPHPVLTSSISWLAWRHNQQFGDKSCRWRWNAAWIKSSNLREMLQLESVVSGVGAEHEMEGVWRAQLLFDPKTS